MTDEQIFSEDERQLLAVLLTREWVRIKDDPDMLRHAEELREMRRKVSGVDTVLVARKVR